MALTLSGKQVATTDQPDWLESQAQTTSTAATNQVIDPATGMPRGMGTYGGQLTAGLTPEMQQAQQNAFNLQSPDYATVNTQMSDAAATAQGQVRDPSGIAIGASYAPGSYAPTTFDPAKVDFANTLAGYNPNVTAFSSAAAQLNAPAYSASSYSFSPERVAAERIAGLDRSGIRDVTAPGGLQAYLMGPASNVVAPELRDFLINQPGLVSADRLDPARQWTDSGIQQKYMDPYMQSVVDVERRKAREAFNEQLVQSGGRAAAAGAFGGSRQAVLEGSMRRDYANQLGDIQATGLERAYQNAQQQFERDRLAGVDTGKFNITTGLQAGLANQGALLDAAKANQAAQLGVQSTRAQTGLQAAISNQQAGLTVGQANQQAQMAAQQLKANLAQQAALANQQADISFSGQGLDAAKANQMAGLQANLANQQQMLEAQVKGAQLSQSDKQFAGNLAQQAAVEQAHMNQQTALANQQAQMQAQELGKKLGFESLQTQYQGGLQAGIANQGAQMDAQKMSEQSKQFGFDEGQRAAQFGADLDLRGQTATESARNAVANTNLSSANSTADIWRGIGANDTQAFNNDLATGKFQYDVGKDTQTMAQQGADRDFAMWQLQQQYPMASLAQLQQILAQNPNMSTQTTESYTKAQSPWQIIAGLGMQFGGMAMPGGGSVFGNLLGGGAKGTG